jgi:hypothetical protein
VINGQPIIDEYGKIMPTKLFNECVDVLKANILTPKENIKISELFIKTFPLTCWGKIDWGNVETKEKITASNQIILTLEKLLGARIDKAVYVEWSEGDLPAIHTNLDDIINNFDDLTSVAFDTFIFNITDGYIIEILSSGEITLGLINRQRIFSQ